MGRCSSLQGMGKGRNGRCLHRAGSGWQSHWQAQGAVHCSVAGYSAVVAVHGHQFEHAAAGTHQFGGLGRHQRRGHRHTQRQSKPHQHEAGEVAQLSEGLHGLLNLSFRCLSTKSSMGLSSWTLEHNPSPKRTKR